LQLDFCEIYIKILIFYQKTPQHKSGSLNSLFIPRNS